MSNRNIRFYSEITNDDCVYYTGKQLKSMYESSSAFHHLEFEIIENGKRVGSIDNPWVFFEDTRNYKCYEYGGISGSCIEYNHIAILR